MPVQQLERLESNAAWAAGIAQRLSELQQLARDGSRLCESIEMKIEMDDFILADEQESKQPAM